MARGSARGSVNQMHTLNSLVYGTLSQLHIAQGKCSPRQGMAITDPSGKSHKWPHYLPTKQPNF